MKNNPLFLTASLLLFSSIPSFAALQPANLRCEYRTNPMGIDVARPRLSWTVASSQRGERQTAYQILVASNAKLLKRGRGDLWDSGRVASDETAQIVYGGRALGSAQEAWWSVRTWDRNGKPSAYSGSAHWAMGLLQPSDWHARWVGLSSFSAMPASAVPAAALGAQSLAGLNWVWFPEGNPNVDAPRGTRYFRRTLDLPAGRKVKAAHFRLTADDLFTLYVNGKQVARSEGTDAWKTIRDVNLAQQLVAGQNTLAIATENVMGAAGLIGVLRVEFEAGEPLVVPIDASWKASQTSTTGWQNAGFDDAAWMPAKVIAKIGDQPWVALGQATPPAAVPSSPFLRKTFTLSKPIRRAYAFATALGLYELHLNGQRVSDNVFTPGWTDYKKRVYYQMYDVTPLLKRGANAAGLVVGDGWATGHVGNGGRNRYGLNRPRAMAQINVIYTDGTSATIATDGTWKAGYGPIVEQDLLDGESYDATKEMPGWNTAGFNDAAWQAPDVFEAPQIKIEAYPGVPVRRIMELKPKSVTQPSPGAYVYDLGQNMVGWARLAASGPAGTKIRLRFAEMLNPDGTIYTTNLRGARCIDNYTLKGAGREVWEPRFTFHGFRYVEITGYAGTPPADAITGIVVHSDTPKTGTFTCSSQLVNQLQHNIEWGQRGNFLEVPTDCPQRDERLGWMGDAQIFIRTACNNMDVASFFTKWMVDVEDAQRGEAFTDVSPDVCCGAGTPAWGDAGVIVPWTVYQVYGDKTIIVKHYDAMARWIDWMQKNSKDLVRPAGGYGDWLSIGANTPTEVIATAYFAYSTSLMAKMAHVIGKDDDARKYDTLFNNIKDAFNRAFVSDDGHIKGDTQTNYLMALHFNLLPEDKRATATQYLVNDIEKRNWHISTGFVGVGYMTPTLTEVGQTAVAYRLLNQDTFPSWGFSIRHGATTIWERWDGWTPDKGFQDPGMNSFNHYSMGSVGQWMFATVAGVDGDPDNPGFKRIIIHPRPGGGLTYANATYNSIRGPIASGWRLTNGALQLTVTVPANTTATVYVPTSDAAKVTESGKPVATAIGVKFVRSEAGAAVYEVGSGTYGFAAPQ